MSTHDTKIAHVACVVNIGAKWDLCAMRVLSVTEIIAKILSTGKGNSFFFSLKIASALRNSNQRALSCCDMK